MKHLFNHLNLNNSEIAGESDELELNEEREQMNLQAGQLMKYGRMRACLCRSHLNMLFLANMPHEKNFIFQAVENGIGKFIVTKTFSDNMKPVTLMASEFRFYSEDPNIRPWDEFDTVSVSKRVKKDINFDIEEPNLMSCLDYKQTYEILNLLH